MKVELMSAEAAFNETTYRTIANTILTDISQAIQRACESGFYNTTVNVHAGISKGAIDLVLKELTNKGYKAEFCLGTHAACEHYWDIIKIDWKVESE